jgi:hypothetical protein
MKIAFWIIALAAAIAGWLVLCGVLVELFITPQFDLKLKNLLESGLNGSIGKIDQIRIEVQKQQAFRDFGTIGGVLFGFVAGVFAAWFSKKN